jgi:MICOS complex subunit MIC60
MLYLVLVGGLSYGLAVFYALKSDNFHDFFTEYIPYGEEAVLYFEERAFHKRFPNARINQSRVSMSAPTDGSKVTIPSKSGMSWKISDLDEGGTRSSQRGRHMSALDANKHTENAGKNAQQGLPQTSRSEKSENSVSSSDSNSSSKSISPSSDKKSSLNTEAASTTQTAAPATNDDSGTPAIRPVDNLSVLEVGDGGEPLAQDLAKIVNDLIAVINADSADASNRYSAPITKAKESLAGFGAKISALKLAERQAADAKVRELRNEYNEGAKELARRIDAARSEELAQYREEFESERERLSRSYEGKLTTETERAQQIFDQRIKNELTEQAIELKRKFLTDIQTLVEHEREGRLSRISELSTNVNDLQKLTSDWNGVIDSNLATQKLQVAVDAVRSSISRAAIDEGQPKPFVSELAALKEVADGDPVVDAAIASMNPITYQRGLPSSAQLLDRFRRVSTEVRKASLLPESAGVGSHFASLLLSRIMFKKQGQPRGDDVESILTRSETLLEEGDLDGAAREVNTLSGWAGVLSRDWLQECRRVLEVRQALDVSVAFPPIEVMLLLTIEGRSLRQKPGSNACEWNKPTAKGFRVAHGVLSALIKTFEQDRNCTVFV